MKLGKSIYDSLPVWAQTIAVNIAGARDFKAKYGGVFHGWLEDLTHNERKSRDEMLRQQQVATRRLLEYAVEHVPFYRERKFPVDDLAAWPILDKVTVAATPEKFLSEEFAGRDRLELHTSGTTGTPLTVRFSKEYQQIEMAFRWRHKAWAGVPFLSSSAYVSGHPVVPANQAQPPFWRWERAEQRLLCSSYHLAPQNLSAYVAALERYSPDFIHGYPSSLYLLAQHGVGRYRPRAVFTASETLLDFQRQAIEETFRTKVFNWYGNTEMTCNIVECAAGNLHYRLDYGVLELLPDGTMIVTGLNNRAMPLIRYRVGDRAVAKDGDCPCGCAFPLIERIEGRVEDYIRTPDGRYVGRLDHLFKQVRHVREAQIVQKSLEEIVLRIVRAEGYTKADERTVHAEARQRLGDNIRMRFEYVDAIDRTSAGKFRFIVSELRPEESRMDRRIVTEPVRFLSPPILESRRIQPQEFARHYEEKYRHPVAKGLFFTINEGIRQTLRKYQSKRAEKRVEEQQAILLARFDVGGKRLAGITRDLGEPHLFHPKLVFSVEQGHDLDEVQLGREAVGRLEAYLAVPSCPLPAELPTLICRENPFLRCLDSGSTLEPYIQRLASVPAVRPGKRVFLIGFGSYVREYILPHVHNEVALAVDYKASLIRNHISTEFPVCAQLAEARDQITTAHEPLVIISTYHSDHAAAAMEVLKANPQARVFIEKPAAVEVVDAQLLAAERRRGAWIDIGYNRRYAPLTGRLREWFQRLPRPVSINMLVKELALPPSHWYFWPNQGTRITGNLCHWIDLTLHLTQEMPAELTMLPSGDNVAVGMRFTDGTLVNISATDIGSGLHGVEEFIEIRGGDTTLSLFDFKKLTVRSSSTSQTFRRFVRDKGHAPMYRSLVRCWHSGSAPVYPAADIVRVTLICRQLSEMLTSTERHYRMSSDETTGPGL
jgi:phenylacetate-CoA ligase